VTFLLLSPDNEVAQLILTPLPYSKSGVTPEYIMHFIVCFTKLRFAHIKFPHFSMLYTCFLFLLMKMVCHNFISKVEYIVDY